MKRVLLLLMIGVLVGGCATQKNASTAMNENIETYAEESFSKIYGFSNIHSTIDPYEEVRFIEGVVSGQGLIMNYRIRNQQKDYTVYWKNFSKIDTNISDVYPFKVQATCTRPDCFRIAVLVSYQDTRESAPRFAAVLLQVDSSDETRYQVIHAAPAITENYLD